jgi:hypothetical protein
MAMQAVAVLGIAAPMSVLTAIGVTGYALLLAGPAAMFLVASAVLTLAGERRPAPVPVRRRSF